MSAEQNRNFDRLVMFLGPLGAVAVALWYVGVYKGQTDARLANHDSTIASLSTVVSTDHDVLMKMTTQVADLHDWLRAKTQANINSGK